MHPDGLKQVHVQPGESLMICNPGILCTLLGSCLGITFWVKRLQIGALCHPMLPAVPTRRAIYPGDASAQRYVDFAIRELASQFDALGVSRRETQIKVFGGADVLELNRSPKRPTVGKLNRETAEHILRVEGYLVTAGKIGGHEGMHIQFNTRNGEVLLRRLGRLASSSHPHRPRGSQVRAE